MPRKLYLHLFILTISNISTASGQYEERVFNGSEATPGEYSPIVWLTREDENGQFIDARGASIINELYILTAGHSCFDPPSNYVAIAGVHNFSEPESHWQRRRVEEIFIHPRWNLDNDSADYDVCVMKLTEAFDLGASPRIQRSNFTFNPLPDDTKVAALGWGRLSPEGSFSPVLRKAELTTVNLGLCNVTWEGILDESMLCASSPDQYPCYGDSGGPVIYRDPISEGAVQVGVVSFGYECGSPIYPAIFAHVPKLLDWILNATTIH